MSNPSFQQAKRRLARRAIIFFAVIIAASAAVVLLNIVSPSARGAMVPLRAVTTTSTPTAIPTATPTPAASPTASAAPTPPSQPAKPAVAASARVLNVWTAGFQTQINECRGGVDVTAHYGPRTIAEHWQCGGRSFPTAAGTIVTITGLDAGTYRVIGLVATLNAYTAHTSQIPRGYDLLFQTCGNGNSRTTEFIALQRIG